MAYPPVLSKRQWPFTPQSLPNCVCWLDAADTSSYTPGTDIRAWRNKVVYGTTPAYTTGSPDPACTADSTSTTINGLTALTCNGNENNNLQFRLPAITYTQPSRTVFFVIKDSTFFSSDGFFASTFTYTSETIGFGLDTGVGVTNALEFYSESQNSNCSFNVYFYPTSEINIICCTTLSTNYGILANGSFLSPTYIGNTLDNFPTGTDSSQYVGCNISSFPRALGDVLIFDGALTNTERQQVEGYLANKWGIQSQLPPSHPYYADNPTAIIRPPNNRPFQPVDIAGCQLWLDAADSSSITGVSPVTAWRDKSGNGNNTTTVTGSPTVSTQSGNQYVSLNGSSGFSGAVSITSNTLSTFAVIIIPGTASGNSRIVSLGAGTDISNPLYVVSLYQLNTTTNLATYRNTTSTSITNTITNSPIIASSTYDSINGYIYLNGGVPTSYGSSGAFGVTNYGIGRLVSGASLFFTGYIGEVIIYNTAVTNSQRLQIESYLAQKWGIPTRLPASHPGRFLPSFSTQFTLKAITGLQLWLDAADASTILGTAANVTKWLDKSGLANDLSSNAGTPQYITDTSGYKALYLNGSSTMIRTPFSFGSADPFTIFIVGKFTPVSTTYIKGPWFMTDASNNAGYFPRWDDNKSYVICGGSGWATQTSIMSANTTYMSAIVSGGAVGSELSFYVNAAKQTMDPSLTTVQGAFKRTDLRLGYRGTDTDKMNGNIYEFIQFNTLLPPTQRQQVEGYLAWKWGLAPNLPSTHPYAKFSP